MKPKAKSLIERFGFKDTDLTTPEHDKILVWLLKKENIIQVLKELEITKEWRQDYKMQIKAEFPIMSNRYNIGFIDLRVFLKHSPQKRIYMGNSYTQWEEQRIYIEIKPYIKSIGELIRQINFYRSHLRRSDRIGKFIVITKTQGLKNLLKNQDILVYELPLDF